VTSVIRGTGQRDQAAEHVAETYPQPAASWGTISQEAKTRLCGGPTERTDGAVEIRRGVYQHYKRRLYSVIGCATQTETGEELVIYRALYGERQLFARPKSMFLETVTVEGLEVARFEYVGDAKAKAPTP
jgi:hypothetical protein